MAQQGAGRPRIGWASLVGTRGQGRREQPEGGLFWLPLSSLLFGLVEAQRRRARGLQAASREARPDPVLIFRNP